MQKYCNLLQNIFPLLQIFQFYLFHLLLPVHILQIIVYSSHSIFYCFRHYYGKQNYFPYHAYFPSQHIITTMPAHNRKQIFNRKTALPELNLKQRLKLKRALPALKLTQKTTLLEQNCNRYYNQKKLCLN